MFKSFVTLNVPYIALIGLRCIVVALCQEDYPITQMICNIQNTSTTIGNNNVKYGIGVVFLRDRVVLECILIDSDGRELHFPSASDQQLEDGTEPHLNVTIQNSTWFRQFTYKVESNGSRWTFPLESSDLFKSVTDFDLPPEPSEIHSNVLLKWVVRLAAFHPMLPDVVHHRIIVVHETFEPLLRCKWGLSIEQQLSADIFESRFSLPHTNIFALETPCQSGCALLVVSNQSHTYIASSCDNYHGRTSSWYLWACPFTNPPRCNKFSFIDGVYASDRVLFVTSHGIMVSESVSIDGSSATNKTISYSLIEAPFARFLIDWSTAKLSFSPFCSAMDYVLSKGDVVLLVAASTSGEKFVFGSVDPFASWTLYPKLNATSPDDVTATYDRQTGSVISIHTDSRSTYSQVHLRTDLETSSFATARFPRFVISGKTDQPIRTLLLSNHYYYVTVGSELWLSTDGGNFFSKIFDLEDGEFTLQLIGFETSKSFAIMTSQGRVLWSKAGLDQMENISSNVNTLRAIVSFDHVGDVILINNHSTSSAPPSVNTVNIPHLQGLQCRVFMTTPGRMISLNTLQFKDIYVHRVHIHQNAVLRSRHQSWMSVNVGNPRAFQTSTNWYRLGPYSQVVEIKVSSQFLVQAVTSVSVALRGNNDNCHITSTSIIIVADCHHTQRLRFDYTPLLRPGTGPLLSVQNYTSSEPNATRDLLFDLPENYRAPSSLAVAIPLSSHLYNVHPTTINSTRFLSYSFAEEQRLKSFCKDATNRSGCACTAALKFSSLVKHSDCREKVYKVQYNILYDINLSVTKGYGVIVDDVSVRDDVIIANRSIKGKLVYLEEVNGRDESVFFISDNGASYCSAGSDHLLCRARAASSSQDMAKLRDHMTSGRSGSVFNASQLKMRFMGSGLFHFRVSLINGFSFCKLQDEFQVYVFNPPLPFPTGTMIRVTVSAVMGIVLIFIYTQFVSSENSADELEEEASNPRIAIRHIPRNTSMVSGVDVEYIQSKLNSSGNLY